MSRADVTIDTNVLLHSCNPNEQRQQDSVSFLNNLLQSPVSLAIDPGFSTDPALNTSLIGAEYLAKLVPNTLPSYVVMQLALTGRVSVIPASLTPQLNKKLSQMIKNKRDRTFVKVSANSNSRRLVSHDFKDFPSSARRSVQAVFGVNMLDAASCNADL